MGKNEEIKNEEWSYKKILLEIWSWVYSLLFAVVAVLIIKNFLFSGTIVRMQSMYPTLKEYNMLIINRFDQVRGVPLKRGDIVVFEEPERFMGTIAQYPEETVGDIFRKLFWKRLYVKRVIAVPGDQLTIEDGILYLNGEAQDEPYVNPENDNNGGDLSVLIPEGYVFCAGDNRGSSWDSRAFGIVPIDRVEGTANFRIFPFNNFGIVD